MQNILWFQFLKFGEFVLLFVLNYTKLKIVWIIDGLLAK